MDRKAWWAALLTIQLGLFFGVAAWLRVGSLGSVPWNNGDESFYGTQAARIVQGRWIATKTPSGNVVSPYLLAFEAPLHLVCRPSLVVLRIPSVACGIAAVVLAYVLGRRIFDRPTALIAAMYLAALPVENHISRLAREQSHMAALGLIAFYFAFRARPAALVATLGAGLLVHPTNVFLVPMVLPVLLVRLWQAHADDPARRRRLLVRSTSALAVLAGGAAVWLGMRPNVQYYLTRNLTRLSAIDGPHFLDRFSRFFFWSTLYQDDEHVGRIAYGLFWGMVVFALAFGLPRLIRARRWDQLTMVVSLMATLAGFVAMAGSDVFDRHEWRYAVVFLVPVVLSFACLLRAALALDDPGERPTRAGLAFAVVLLAAWPVLLGAPTTRGGASLWSLAPRVPEPYARAYQLIRRDLARSNRPPVPPATRHLVFCEDYWVHQPLRYLSVARDDVATYEVIANFITYRQGTGDPAEYERQFQRVRRWMDDGAYTVHRPDTPLDLALQRDYPPPLLQRWVIPNEDGTPYLVVSHRRREVTQASRPVVRH